MTVLTNPLSSCSFSHMNLLWLSPPNNNIHLFEFLLLVELRYQLLTRLWNNAHSITSQQKCFLSWKHYVYTSHTIHIIHHQFLFIYSFTFHFNSNNLEKTSSLYIITQYQIQFINQICIKTYLQVISIKVLSQVIFNPLNNNQKFSHNTF